MFSIVFKAMLNQNILRKSTKLLKMDPDSREIPLGLLSACSMNTFVTLQEPTIVMYYHQVLVEFPPRCQSFSENGFHRHFFLQFSLIFLAPFGQGGGGGTFCPTLAHICVYPCKYMCELVKKLDFSQL